MSAKKLTPKQQLFVAEYLVDLNATQAAIRAGYAPKAAGATAHNLLKKTEIQVAISEAVAEREKRTGITADWVLNSLRKVAERCMDDEHFDSSGANRSLELLGRHLKLFTDKVEQSGPGGGPIEVSLKALLDEIDGSTRKLPDLEKEKAECPTD